MKAFWLSMLVLLIPASVFSRDWQALNLEGGASIKFPSNPVIGMSDDFKTYSVGGVLEDGGSFATMLVVVSVPPGKISNKDDLEKLYSGFIKDFSEKGNISKKRNIMVDDLIGQDYILVQDGELKGMVNHIRVFYFNNTAYLALARVSDDSSGAKVMVDDFLGSLKPPSVAVQFDSHSARKIGSSLGGMIVY